MDEGNEILTIEEVAKLLKLKPQTIYKWAQEGKIPGAKLGKEWRFRRRILDDWVETAIMTSRGGVSYLMERGGRLNEAEGMDDERIDAIVRATLE